MAANSTSNVPAIAPAAQAFIVSTIAEWSALGLDDDEIYTRLRAAGVSDDAIVAAYAPSTAIWMPLPGPQTLAYESEADELYYGGAAGGGKSDLLLGLASTKHVKSLILRREASQLKEIVPRSQDIIGLQGRFNGSGAGSWRDLPGGRSIEFGGCEGEFDKQKYKGRAHDFKGFDELPDFTESQYIFIGAWNRTTVPGQRCRRVGAGNPPSTAEGEWVLRRWGPWLDATHPYPAKPAELRWYAMVEGKEIAVEDGKPFDFKGFLITPWSRTFIPAKVSDNPHLYDTGYMATLQALPEPLRSQLAFGDFTVGRDDDPWQVIPTEWVKAAQARWTPIAPPFVPMAAMGVDVARGGTDQTVLSTRRDGWFAPLLKYPGTTTPDGPAVATLVVKAITDKPALNVDVIGVGASVYDTLKSHPGLTVNGINFGEGSSARDRSGKLAMRNKRSEAYWRLRESLDPVKGDNIALPPDDELRSDLCAGRWSLTTSGILIESKEDIKKRIGRSTDCGDAVALCNMPASTKKQLRVL